MSRKSGLPEPSIVRAFRALDDHPVGSEEYVKILDCIAKLHKMRIEEKSTLVSNDTMATIGANLLGILLIIKHERVNVVTSKALSFVTRLRI